MPLTKQKPELMLMPAEALLRLAQFFGFELLEVTDGFVVQGDHSACAKPPIDFKTKVPWNFWFEVKGRFCTS